MEKFNFNEKMMELNPELYNNIRRYKIVNELKYYDIVVLFGGREDLISYDPWSFLYHENYRIAIYEFFKSNEDKIPLWIELLKLKML